jgi:hypothetical protein
MRCPNCYNEVPDEATSCPSCTFLLPAHYQANREQTVLSDLGVVTGSRRVVDPAKSQSVNVPPVTPDRSKSATTGTVSETSGVVDSGTVADVDTAPVDKAMADQAMPVEAAEEPSSPPDSGGDAQAPPPAVADGSSVPVYKTGARTQSLNGAARTATRTGSRRVPPPSQRTSALAKGKAKSKEKDEAQSRGNFIALALGALIVVLGLMVYVYMFTDLLHGGVTGPKAISALTSFRTMPSNSNGMTLDQLAAAALTEARKNKTLAQYSGWTTTPIEGDRSKVLITFSYNETDNTEHKAEWEVNLSSNTVTPRTDLAKEMYSGSTFARSQ